MRAQAELQEFECAAQRHQSRNETANLAKMCAETLRAQRSLSSRAAERKAAHLSFQKR